MERYWEQRIETIEAATGRRMRETDRACFEGKKGLAEWRTSTGHGVMACYVDGVAKVRWIDYTNLTYGIVDSSGSDLRRLVNWWANNSP